MSTHADRGHAASPHHPLISQRSCQSIKFLHKFLISSHISAFWCTNTKKHLNEFMNTNRGNKPWHQSKEKQFSKHLDKQSSDESLKDEGKQTSQLAEGWHTPPPILTYQKSNPTKEQQHQITKTTSNSRELEAAALWWRELEGLLNETHQSADRKWTQPL